MTVNRRRGEIAAELDGRTRRLCLTLGALAGLEASYAADDLNQLVERFSRGRLSASDLICVIAAGLRGAGEDVDEEDVAAMSCDGGVAGFAAIVAELLGATFGSGKAGDTPANP